MSLLANQNRDNSVPMLPLGLFTLAILTVSCKFIGPILYYIAEHLARRPLEDVPVLWDFWWPVYLISASALYSRSRSARPLFLLLAGVRIIFSIVVLTLCFVKAEWTFWTLQWLFCEISALFVMASGAFLALSSAGRDQLSVRARPVSLTS